MKLQTAKKILKPMKVLMYGPSNSGKTMGSLLLAAGIIAEQRKCSVEDAYKHIVVIDSEYGRGSMYSNLGEYFYVQVDAPYTTEKLNSLLIELSNEKDIDVIIIDSLTHYWSKAGGILEQKNEKDKLGGNSYTNWQDYTMLFNKLIDNILGLSKHIIVTARAKSDTVMTENSSGKLAPKTYGLKPDLRDGIDFEFDVTINVDKNDHSLLIEKGFPGLDISYDKITVDTGRLFYKIATDNATPVERSKENIITSIRNICKTSQSLIQFVQLELSGRKMDDLTPEQLKDLESKVILKVKENQTKSVHKM